MNKRFLGSAALSLFGLGAAMPAWSADAQLELTLPKFDGFRVQRPYVAIWVEKAASHDFVGNIAVWHSMDKPAGALAKWLPDLRSWWRASGSQASFPIDGVSGATRPAGDYTVNLGAAAAMNKLPAGEYEIVVEAAREKGGHDLVRLPLQWPPKAAAKVEARGSSELGALRLTTKP